MLHDDTRAATLLNSLRANGLEQKTLLAPSVDIPMLHYYFPQTRVESYSDISEIPALLNSHQADAVVYPDFSLVKR